MTASSAAIACSDIVSFPSICIPHVKTCIEEGGASGSVIPMTKEFIKTAFSRYGEISEVVMTTRYTADRNSHTRGAEEYYRVHIHFKRWNIENGEARYVRSVLMSSSTTAGNIKLSYSGPWYWKFSALRH
jgi:hypothetical protein